MSRKVATTRRGKITELLLSKLPWKTLLHYFLTHSFNVYNLGKVVLREGFRKLKKEGEYDYFMTLELK